MFSLSIKVTENIFSLFIYKKPLKAVSSPI